MTWMLNLLSALGWAAVAVRRRKIARGGKSRSRAARGSAC